MKTGLDVAGAAAFNAPFVALAPFTAGLSMVPMGGMYAEALFMAPTGTAHGASEFVDGVKTGNFERALDGAGEFCGNVGVVLAAAGGIASTAGKVVPPPRPPITLFKNGVPVVKPKPPTPPPPPPPKAIVSDGKFGYLFGKGSGNDHNIQRTRQNVTKLRSVGIVDDAEGRRVLQKHFDETVADPSNVKETFMNKWGTYEKRESLLCGPDGFLNSKRRGRSCPTGTDASRR